MGKTTQDAKKVLALLADESLSPAAVGELVGATAPAVDEARCLVEEIREAESDAILAMPPVLARALLRAAVDAERISLLAEAALAGDKEIRKEARRLAHHLELRGVEVEMPRQQAPAPAVEEKEDLPVLLSNPDGTGRRVAIWTRHLPGRGVELADFLLDDEGIRDLGFATLSRGQFQKRLANLPTGPIRLFIVPREEVGRVLDRARIAGKASGALPTNFAPWAARVLPPAPQTPPGPLEPLGEGRAEGDEADWLRLAGNVDWFGENEFEYWVPAQESLRRLQLAQEEVEVSPLFLPGAQGEMQREEARRAAVEREAATYFDLPRRQRTAARLSDMARLFELSGRTAQARSIHATSLLLAREGVVVEQIPFCSAFFSRFASPAKAKPEEAQAEAAQAEEASPLILRP